MQQAFQEFITKVFQTGKIETKDLALFRRDIASHSTRLSPEIETYLEILDRKAEEVINLSAELDRLAKGKIRTAKVAKRNENILWILERRPLDLQRG